jgi:hypothetical protein
MYSRCTLIIINQPKIKQTVYGKSTGISSINDLFSSNQVSQKNLLYSTGIEHEKSMKNVPPYFELIDEKISWFDKKNHLYLKEFNIETIE